MKLALKVDVDTWRGTREGVPRLIELLGRHGAGATFLFSLGPDHTGRAIRRALRPGFASKVSRTSVLEHYGLKTLLYGTLLPGPDIGRGGAAIMRSARDAGFETGVHSWDHVRWQDGVPSAGAQWTSREMNRAFERYTEIFDAPPATHGAAGWQMNVHAFRLEQQFGLSYASDTRGTGPFVPLVRAEPFACVQLPTTLPTIDELIGLDGVDRGNVAAALLAATESPPRHGHVFTLHAELEGGAFASAFEQLLAGWKSQGYRLVSLRDYAEGLDRAGLPRNEVIAGTLAGRSGMLAMQGREYLTGV